MQIHVIDYNADAKKPGLNIALIFRQPGCLKETL